MIEIYHVIPTNDLEEHADFNCKCRPVVYEGENLVVHNSFDGREFVENTNIFDFKTQCDFEGLLGH